MALLKKKPCPRCTRVVAHHQNGTPLAHNTTLRSHEKCPGTPKVADELLMDLLDLLSREKKIIYEMIEQFSDFASAVTSKLKVVRAIDAQAADAIEGLTAMLKARIAELEGNG